MYAIRSYYGGGSQLRRLAHLCSRCGDNRGGQRPDAGQTFQLVGSPQGMREVLRQEVHAEEEVASYNFV